MLTWPGNRFVPAFRPEAKIRPMRTYLSRIAVAAVILLISFGVWRYLIPGEVRNLGAYTNLEVREVQLPDGSTVWLNQNSMLRFPERFNNKERKVELRGEAYFEVQPDPEKPFLIETGVTEVEVLGTSFNLMAYPDSSRSWVLVNSGKVAFYPKGKLHRKVELVRGETGVYSRPRREMQKLNRADINKLAWKTKQLVFENTPMEEVAKTLEETFKIEIQFESPAMKKCKITGEFPVELEEVLTMLQFVLNVKVEKKEKNIILFKGKGCE